MPGRSTAPKHGHQLKHRVVEIATKLGLEVKTEVPVGRRIWGVKRRIDVVLRKPNSDKILGIECKYQGTSGTAEEKLAIVLEDIKHWPIPGIVVIDGEGFSEKMRGYLTASGKVVEFADLEEWLRLFFLIFNEESPST